MPFKFTLSNLKTLESEVLTGDPIGWDEALYSLKRSERYKSVMHEYGTSLKFHCQGGGKDFIDAIYKTDDIDGRIDILIEYDCDGSGTYDTLFNGILNLATYSADNIYTSCQIERSDLYSKFISRDSISVDLATTTSIGGQEISAIPVKSLGLTATELAFKQTWFLKAGYSYSYSKDYTIPRAGSSPPTIPPPHPDATQFDFTLIDKTTDPTFNVFTGGQTAEVPIAPSFMDNPLPALLTVVETNITTPILVDWAIDWHGTMHNEDTSSGSRDNLAYYLVLCYGQKGGTVFYEEIISPANTTTKDFTTSISVTDSGQISLNPGDSVWLTWVNIESAGVQVDVNFTFSNDSTFSLSANTSYKSTLCDTVLIHEAFGQVVDAITDGDNNFVSNFYGRTDSAKRTYDVNGCGSLVGLTTGLNIRQFAGKSIFASFEQLFNAMDCIHNIGASYFNGKIQVEPLAYWFDNTTKVISLPFVNTFTEKKALGSMFNKILIGYEKWESEYKGGLDEVNTKREYSTIIASAQGIYSKICSFITGSYAIELTRRKNIARELYSTTDWKFDNDNFLLALFGKIITPGRFRDTINAIEVDLLLNQLSAGDTFTITGSSSNDGTFTVDTVTLFNDAGYTQIIVLETIVSEISAGFTIQGITNNLYSTESYSNSFSSGSGMVGLNTAKNLRFTPGRMLLAHLNVITAALQKIKGDIAFIKGDGNTSLVLTKNDVGCQEDYSGEPFTENKNIAWNDTNALNAKPLFTPEIYSFEYPLKYNDFKTIKANPNGYLEFYQFENEKKAGFILDMQYKLKTGMTKFELLRMYAPDSVGDGNGNYVG